MLLGAQGSNDQGIQVLKRDCKIFESVCKPNFFWEASGKECANVYHAKVMSKSWKLRT